MFSLCDEDSDDYNAEITRLHLKKRRVSDHEAQIHSSFSGFPNEILCIIFESTCTENLLQECPWSPRNPNKATTRTSPAITYLPTLAIGAVCTKWRSLVLGSPELWSRLRLETLHQAEAVPCVDSGFIATLQLFLDRSADAPLTISMETERFGDLDSALSLLLNHTHRWKSFDYTGDNKFSNWMDSHFPILENLTLRASEVGFARENYSYFMDAPKLRTVTAGGWVYDLDVVWGNLTSLDIWAPEGKRARELHDLALMKLWRQRRTFEPSITSLAKLESFTVVKTSWAFTYMLLHGMFSSFTFPSLNELVIFVDENNAHCSSTRDWPSDAFGAFISRSGCVLTTLSLTVTISDEDLIAALRILPSLTNLAVDSSMDVIGCPISSRFISCMHVSSPNLILPRLRSLYIKSHSTSFNDAEFIDMISSRWLPDLIIPASVGIDCLRSLVLHFLHRTVDEEVYEPLWDLDKMGMRVVVTGMKEA